MMGVARKVDGLGRVVIPMEFRKSMGIEPGDQVEVFSEDGKIVLVFGKKCAACGAKEELHSVGKFTVCRECLALATEAL